MDQDDPTPDDFDTPWKTTLTRYLPEFMAFYFPEAYAAIDWRQPHRFLDQELAQVVRDAGLGKRLVDRLVEVAPVASGPQGAPRFGGQISNLSPCPRGSPSGCSPTTTACTTGIIARWPPWRCWRTSRRAGVRCVLAMSFLAAGTIWN